MAGVAPVLHEDLDAGLVHLYDVVGQELGAQLRHQRGQQEGELEHPAGQGGAGQFHPEALQDALLARQRQGVLVFGHRDVGQRPGRGVALGDRLGRQGRGPDGLLADAAGVT